MVKWHYISSLMFNQHCHCHTHTRLSQTVQFRCLHPKCLKERERRGVEEGGWEAGRGGFTAIIFLETFPCGTEWELKTTN